MKTRLIIGDISFDVYCHASLFIFTNMRMVIRATRGQQCAACREPPRRAHVIFNALFAREYLKICVRHTAFHAVPSHESNYRNFHFNSIHLYSAVSYQATFCAASDDFKA